MRRIAFIDHVLEVDGFARQARALLDRAFERVLGHGHLAGLLHHETQLGVGCRVGTAPRGDHDFLGQLAKQLALGVGNLCLAL
ncbi:hypothetical protein D3C85_1622040 [compost metagenome]